MSLVFDIRALNKCKLDEVGWDVNGHTLPILALFDKKCLLYRVFSRPVALLVVTMETRGQTNQPSITKGSPLRTLLEMLIRYQHVLPLARNNRNF